MLKLAFFLTLALGWFSETAEARAKYARNWQVSTKASCLKLRDRFDPNRVLKCYPSGTPLRIVGQGNCFSGQVTVVVGGKRGCMPRHQIVDRRWDRPTVQKKVSPKIVERPSRPKQKSQKKAVSGSPEPRRSVVADQGKIRLQRPTPISRLVEAPAPGTDAFDELFAMTESPEPETKKTPGLAKSPVGAPAPEAEKKSEMQKPSTDTPTKSIFEDIGIKKEEGKPVSTQPPALKPARAKTPVVAETDQRSVFRSLTNIADRHEGCARSRPRNRSRLQSRVGYYHGTVLSFARSVCRFDGGIKAAMTSGSQRKFRGRTLDVLQHYTQGRHQVRTYGGITGEKSLISLYAILLPQGLMESGGDFREGVDITNRSSFKAHTAEAGLHQTSYNVKGLMSRSATQAMRDLEKKYRDNPSACMTNVFSKGLRKKRHRTPIGSGAGVRFQKLLRSCPALAVEHAAITTRHNVAHYGPLKRKNTKPLRACYPMLEEVFKKVQAEKESLCPAMAVEPVAVQQPVLDIAHAAGVN